MRGSRDIVAVILLLLAFVAGGLLLGGRGAATGRVVSEESGPNPSIANNRASGSRGVFQWVKSQGYQPAAWRQSWTGLDPAASDVLLVIDPQVEQPFATLTGGAEEGKSTRLSARDAGLLEHWLASGRGHTAILLSSRIAAAQSGAKPSPDNAETFGDALDLVVESASPSTGRTEFAPLQPVWDTQGILSVHSDADARNRPHPARCYCPVWRQRRAAGSGDPGGKGTPDCCRRRRAAFQCELSEIGEFAVSGKPAGALCPARRAGAV